MGQRFRAAAYTALALLVFLATLDVVLRVTHVFGARVTWTEPDPVLGYRNTPGRPYWHLKENDHAITGRINALGWRDRERSLEKSPGTYRVAVLGDSQVESFPVELDSSFLAIAERDLDEPGNPVEFWNLGRSSMTQTEQLLLMRQEVPRLSPDLVLLLFMPVNDIADVRRATASHAERPFFREGPDGALTLDTSFRGRRSFRLKGALNPLKQRSALVSLAMQRFQLLRRSRRRSRATAPPADAPERIAGALSLCTRNPDPAYVTSYQLNRRLIREIAGRCRAMDVPFALVCCEWFYQTEDLQRCRRIDASFQADFFETDLGALADSLGIAYLGLQSVFTETYAATGEPLTWGHWNYAGHRLVAEQVMELVTRIRAGASPPRGGS